MSHRYPTTNFEVDHKQPRRPAALVAWVLLTTAGCASDAAPPTAAHGGGPGSPSTAGAGPYTAGRATPGAGGSAGSATTGRSTAGRGGAGPGAAAVGGTQTQPPPGRSTAGGSAVTGAGRGATAGASAGASAAAGSAAPPPTATEPLDCGPNGVAIENAGPPKNRVNYVIVGDGYTEAQLTSTFMQHIQTAMNKRFSEVIGQPYGRYRKFVNICALKVASQSGPIGSGPTPFECTGDDQSRLARCNTSKVNAAIAEHLPDSFEVDWKAVMLNNDRWWNTGAALMLWSGAHKDAAGAALHEGGHGFHQLADEYTGTDSNCTREFGEVNVTADAMQTAGKWDMWLGYDQVGATGKQTTIAGARYCNAGQYRPTQNSMMNQLFGNNPNTAYNSVSREKMIMDIWRAVVPIDKTTPAPGTLDKPGVLEVRVIDPEVIHVDWSVDDKVVAADGGETLEVSMLGLSSGTHTISARAYDTAGTDWVRYTSGTQYGRMNWARSQQTVSWTLTLP